MDQTDLKKLSLFLKTKRDSLSKVDLSRKGSIDEPIRQLVNSINQNNYYFTTSTCSGRITLIDKPHDQPGVKKDSNFVLVSHEPIDFEKFDEAIKQSRESREERDLWLKFEPFIMHVQCYDLARAKVLLNIGLDRGCRNSGITLSKNEKFMVAIRSTSSMEVPIRCGSKFELGVDYLKFLCEECNRRLVDNMEKLSIFEKSIKNNLCEVPKEQGTFVSPTSNLVINARNPQVDTNRSENNDKTKHTS